MHPTSEPGRHIVDGTVRLFLAEALILPTGLLTVIFLTRRLGPQGYGLFTLAAVVVAWVEWSIPSIFSRPTIKFVGEAEDWRPVGNLATRLILIGSCGVTVLLWLLASPISSLLGEPILATYLRFFALDIPIFSMALAHRYILIGIGAFRQRALMSAGRWTTRLLFIVVLVELGFSVPGAILGSILASLVELIIGRMHVRPAPLRSSNFPIGRLFSYAVPLSLFTLSMQLYDKLDLLMLKILGGTAGLAGVYGAAQNLSIVPSLFALAFSPLLLSTLSRTLSNGDRHLAKNMGRDAMRAVILLLPLAGMIAGAAAEIVDLFFGPLFMHAARLLALLIFAAVALVMIWVGASILTAAEKPAWPFVFAGPMVPLAAIGHLLLIPKLGAIGASLVTTSLAALGALASVLAVYRLWGIVPSVWTLCRSILICGIAYGLSRFWPTPGFLLFFKLPLIGVAVALLLGLFGEFSAREISLIQSMLQGQGGSRKNPREV